MQLPAELPDEGHPQRPHPRRSLAVQLLRSPERETLVAKVRTGEDGLRDLSGLRAHERQHSPVVGDLLYLHVLDAAQPRRPRDIVRIPRAGGGACYNIELPTVGARLRLGHDREVGLDPAPLVEHLGVDDAARVRRAHLGAGAPLHRSLGTGAGDLQLAEGREVKQRGALPCRTVLRLHGAPPAGLARVVGQLLVRVEPLRIRLAVRAKVQRPLKAARSDGAEHSAGAGDAVVERRQPHAPRALIAAELLRGVVHGILGGVALKRAGRAPLRIGRELRVESAHVHLGKVGLERGARFARGHPLCHRQADRRAELDAERVEARGHPQVVRARRPAEQRLVVDRVRVRPVQQLLDALFRQRGHEAHRRHQPALHLVGRAGVELVARAGRHLGVAAVPRCDLLRHHGVRPLEHAHH